MPIDIRYQVAIEPTNDKWVFSGIGDPSVVGLTAGIGSIYTQLDSSPPGDLWTKTSSPDTGWTQQLSLPNTSSSPVWANVNGSAVSVASSYSFATAGDFQVQAAMAELDALASVSGAHTVDWTARNVWRFTLTGATTFTFTDPTQTGWSRLFVALDQDATGGRTVTWPASVVWMTGTAYALQTAASARDVVELWFDHSSGKYYAAPYGRPQVDESFVSALAYVSKGNSGTACAPTWALNARKQLWTATGNCTYTITGIPSGESLLVQIGTGTGSFTATFAVGAGMGSLRWFGGSAPTLTTTASKIDEFLFTFNGSNTLGYVVGQAA